MHKSSARTILMVMSLILTACVAQAPETIERERSLCGDGVCGGLENRGNCPEDCPPLSRQGDDDQDQLSGAEFLEGHSLSVINPNSGATLAVEIFLSGRPDAPTVILVPGGTGCGSGFRRTGSTSVNVFLDGGVNVVIFDPDGRCLSEGEEDQDGFIHQDGLVAVIRRVAQEPDLDPDRIGLFSMSFGITMASGALARYPDLPVQFLIDYEGPATRDDTGGCDEDQTGHLLGVVACEDTSFWREREALTFMPDIQVPYYRIQTETDHAQPDNIHALHMVNAAFEGDSPWVHLNEVLLTDPLDLDAVVTYISDDHDGRIFALVLHILPEILAAP